jgi:hypothetical protein
MTLVLGFASDYCIGGSKHGTFVCVVAVSRAGPGDHIPVVPCGAP